MRRDLACRCCWLARFNWCVIRIEFRCRKKVRLLLAGRYARMAIGGILSKIAIDVQSSHRHVKHELIVQTIWMEIFIYDPIPPYMCHWWLLMAKKKLIHFKDHHICLLNETLSLINEPSAQILHRNLSSVWIKPFEYFSQLILRLISYMWNEWIILSRCLVADYEDHQ